MKQAITEADIAQFRLKDLHLTIELLVDAVAEEQGARDRIAQRHRISKSVITDRVKRIETFFSVSLFGGPQRKMPTAAGRLLARRGPQFLKEMEAFSEMLRDAEEDARHERS